MKLSSIPLFSMHGAPPLNLENYIEICLILFQNLKYDNKSAITFLGLSPKKFLHPPSKKNPYIFPKNHHLHRQKSAQKILDWKWLPPIWKLSRNLSGLVWVAVPNVYLPNLIYTSLFIYLLSAASRLNIYQIFFATTSTNEPPSPPDQPTNHRPSVLSPSPTINPIFLYLPYPTINHDN